MWDNSEDGASVATGFGEEVAMHGAPQPWGVERGPEGSARAVSIPSAAEGDRRWWREAELTSHSGIGVPAADGFNEVVVGTARELTKPREAVALRGVASNGGWRRPEVAAGGNGSGLRRK